MPGTAGPMAVLDSPGGALVRRIVVLMRVFLDGADTG